MLLNIAPPILPELAALQSNPYLFVPFATAAVTAADMIPMFAIQPIALALGSTVGWIALPICAIGQLFAAIFSFTLARRSTESEAAQKAYDALPSQAKTMLNKIKKNCNETGECELPDDSLKTFAILIALRLFPFFPCRNYAIGSLTNVGVRSFGAASAIGLVASNCASVGVGVAVGVGVQEAAGNLL